MISHHIYTNLFQFDIYPNQKMHSHCLLITIYYLEIQVKNNNDFSLQL